MNSFLELKRPIMESNASVQQQARYNLAAKPHPKSACQLQRSSDGDTRGRYLTAVGGSDM